MCILQGQDQLSVELWQTTMVTLYSKHGASQPQHCKRQCQAHPHNQKLPWIGKTHPPTVILTMRTAIKNCQKTLQPWIMHY